MWSLLDRDYAPHQHPRGYRRLIEYHPPASQDILCDCHCHGEVVAKEEGGETGRKKGFIPDTVNTVKSRPWGRPLGGLTTVVWLNCHTIKLPYKYLFLYP